MKVLAPVVLTALCLLGPAHPCPSEFTKASVWWLLMVTFYCGHQVCYQYKTIGLNILPLNTSVGLNLRVLEARKSHPRPWQALPLQVLWRDSDPQFLVATHFVGLRPCHCNLCLSCIFVPQLSWFLPHFFFFIFKFLFYFVCMGAGTFPVNQAGLVLCSQTAF